MKLHVAETKTGDLVPASVGLTAVHFHVSVPSGVVGIEDRGITRDDAVVIAGAPLALRLEPGGDGVDKDVDVLAEQSGQASVVRQSGRRDRSRALLAPDEE